VVVGLLLFLNLVSRLLLLTAAFVVTAPYDSDVAPSGTASPEQARKAGIPQQYADGTPDDPPAVLDDGAPTPLAAAVQGRVAPQDEPSGRSWSRAEEPGDEPPAPAPVAGRAAAVVPAPEVAAGERAVRLAASAGRGAVGVLLLAVLAHLVGTLRRLRR
jgi:membrane protein